VDRYRVVDGRILSRRFEINVAEHCNLSCRSCSHLSPVLPKSFVDPNVVSRDLTMLSRSYHTKVVRLLGGEPLLHPDLPAVLEAVRGSSVSDSIAVVTNGLLLPRLEADFWSAVDAVEVSVYPKRALSPALRERCVAQAARHRVALRFRVCNEFQESYSEVGTDDAELVRRIYTTCNVAHRWRCHNVVDGWFYRCPQSHYIPRVLHCQDNESQHADGIRIDDHPSFLTRLLNYLESPVVPSACSNCLGTSGRYHPHEQIRRTEFRDRPGAATEQLVHPRLVGTMRVAFASVESRVPRRIMDSAENAFLSPTLIGLTRRAQELSRRLINRQERDAFESDILH
jgi:organic radical activating enzyme